MQKEIKNQSEIKFEATGLQQAQLAVEKAEK